MNHSSAVHHCTAEEGAILAAALEDRPETVFAAQRLRRGLCPAYLLGSLTAYAYVLVEVFPGQLLGFGDDPRALWQLLQRLRDVHEWKSLGVAPGQAKEVATLLERQSGRAPQTQTVIYSLLSNPVTEYRHPLVRLLEVHEVALALTGPGGSIGAAYGSPEVLLADNSTILHFVNGVWTIPAVVPTVVGPITTPIPNPTSSLQPTATP